MEENSCHEVKGGSGTIGHGEKGIERDLTQIGERLVILETQNACMEKSIMEMQESIKHIVEWAEAVYEFETSRLNIHGMAALEH